MSDGMQWYRLMYIYLPITIMQRQMASQSIVRIHEAASIQLFEMIVRICSLTHMAGYIIPPPFHGNSVLKYQTQGNRPTLVSICCPVLSLGAPPCCGTFPVMVTKASAAMPLLLLAAAS